MRIRWFFALRLGVSTATLLATAETTATSAPEVVFRQEVVAVDADGRAIPPRNIDPRLMDDLVSVQRDLGGDREVKIWHNLGAEREAEVRAVAAVVARCYGVLEAMTGRRIPGGVLLYLVSFDVAPASYTFRVELPHRGRWSQVRLVPVEKSRTLLGARGSPRLQEMLYATLPHELGHNLLAAVPTVRHDVGGEPSGHTRWFIDGVCEILAAEFAMREAPGFWSQRVHERHFATVLQDEQVAEHIFAWSQDDQLPWQVESDLYPAAQLVVSVWLEVLDLADLLHELAAAGGRADGRELRRLYVTQLGRPESWIMSRAMQLGRILELPDTAVFAP